MYVQTLQTLIPFMLSTRQILFLYPSNTFPIGKFGAQVITVTLCPNLTHSVQCSNVLDAGALTSEGNYHL